MSDLFPAADKIVVGIEGGTGNQPGDTGGSTVFGIARNFHADETPWPPTWDRCRELRRTQYWLANHCDQMPWAWALGVFDCAINQPGHGLKSLQEELGLAQDGVIGSVSVAAILRASEEHFTRWMGRRIVAYSGQSLWTLDALGWSVRALTVHHAALLPPV